MFRMVAMKCANTKCSRRYHCERYNPATYKGYKINIQVYSGGEKCTAYIPKVK